MIHDGIPVHESSDTWHIRYHVDWCTLMYDKCMSLVTHNTYHVSLHHVSLHMTHQVSCLTTLTRLMHLYAVIYTCVCIYMCVYTWHIRYHVLLHSPPIKSDMWLDWCTLMYDKCMSLVTHHFWHVTRLMHFDIWQVHQSSHTSLWMYPLSPKTSHDELATISRLFQIISLFCQRDL